MQLIEYFQTLDKLSKEDLQLLAQHFKTLVLNRGDYFLEPGHICNKIGYINEGILRSFFYDENGNEFSHCFIKENGFVTDIEGFYNQTISSQYIVSETNSTLTFFTAESYKIFEREIPNWPNIIKKATEASLTTKIMEKGYMLAQDATSRYLNFSKNHPDILQKVPLKSIASFLGMTKYSISRIRKNIARK